MTALAIILTAAMVLPENGSEKVSGEMVREAQPLDLSGEWEVTWQDSLGRTWQGKLKNGRLECKRPGLTAHGTLKSGDEKEGIYKWEGDRLFLCFSTGRNGRPTSFRGGAGQELFILRRIKPRK